MVALFPENEPFALCPRLFQLSLRFQGRTFGTPGLTALAVNSEDGREQSGGKNSQGDPP
jgi:hypothetical protein